MDPVTPGQPLYKVIGADQKQYGPITADQIRQWIGQHRLNSQSQAWIEGADAWKPLSQFPEFADTLAVPQAGSPGGLPSSYPSAPAQAYPRTNPLAVTSVIMGATSILLACCCYGFPFNVLALVFGVIGLIQIKQNPAWETGAGFAWAGLILAVFSMVLAILLYAWATTFDAETFQQQLDKWRNL